MSKIKIVGISWSYISWVFLFFLCWMASKRLWVSLWEGLTTQGFVVQISLSLNLDSKMVQGKLMLGAFSLHELKSSIPAFSTESKMNILMSAWMGVGVWESCRIVPFLWQYDYVYTHSITTFWIPTVCWALHITVGFFLKMK